MTILRRIARAYRPLDRKLRSMPGYEKVSVRLRQAYWTRLAASSRPLKPGALLNGSAEEVYVRGLDSVPVRRDTILFESYWGKRISDNPLSLYRELVRSGRAERFRIYWTCQKGRKAPDEVRANPAVTLVDPATPAYGLALLEAGYVVNNVTFPSWFIRRDGQRYCNTWHGVPMKAMGRDMVAPLVSMANTQRNFLQSDLLLTSSDYYTSHVIAPSYVDSLCRPFLCLGGTPRVDDTLEPKVDLAAMRAELGIGPNQKVVLFAPTWRGNSLQIADCFATQHGQVQELARRLGEDWFVLFSSHQMVKVADAAASAPNVALLDESRNINDLLGLVDVMVSDYSSVIFDFLPLDRPMVLFTPDLEGYRAERGLYIGPDELPCANVGSLEDLAEAVRALRRPSSFPNYGETVRRFLPHEDGKASSRVLAALLAPPRAQHLPAARKKILIAPGGLFPNGVTSSLKNLISNLDFTQYEPWILIDAAVVDKEAPRREQFADFDPRCNWILRTGRILLTAKERPAYERYVAGALNLAPDEFDTLRGVFRRESRRLLGDTTFDVAIEFGGYAPFWSGIIAATPARRHVIYQHSDLWSEFSNPDPRRSQKQLWSLFQSYRWFDRVVTVSDETRALNERNLRAFYHEDLRTVTVQNTINPTVIRTKASRPVEEELPPRVAAFAFDNAVKFVALGRLSPEKRYDRLIRAFAQAQATCGNAELVIGGDGPLRAELDALVASLGLTDRVLLPGRLSNPYPLLAKADYLVMSSDYEGQPMVLLEALCLGIPCIGTDIPGIRSVLKDGRGTVAPCSVDGLARALERACRGELRRPEGLNFGEDYARGTMSEFYREVCEA